MKHAAGKNIQKEADRGHPITGVVALMLLYSGAGSTATAESSAAPAESVDRSGLEEIIVTSQKRAERLVDVPVTVTAFTAASLQNMGVTSLLQVQQATPSFVLNQAGSVPFLFLRGVGGRVAGNGLDPSVATYVDDRYVARPGGTLTDLMDIERIEVLKGPQGTLYGRNATGGAIRVITNDVGNDFAGWVQGTAGNYGAWGMEGVLNVPVTDTFGVRLAAMEHRRSGFETNLDPEGRTQFDDKNTHAVRLKVRWDINDRVTSRLSLNYWTKNDLSNDAQVAAPPFSRDTAIVIGGINGDRYHVASAIRDPNESDEATADLRFDVKFSAFDFQSITTASQLGNDDRIDADGTSAPITDLIWGRENSRDYGQEFRLLSNKDGKWQWLAGAYGFHGKDNFDSILHVGPAVGSAGKQYLESNGAAIFGDLSYNFIDRWTLRVGGRWSYEEKKVSLVHSPAPVAFAAVPYQDSANWNDFTPSVTLQYKPGFGMLYAKYAEGFKSGGFNYPAGAGSPVLQPEKLKSYEVGYKADLLDNRLRIDTSVFYYDFKDLQVLIASTNSAAVTVTTQNAASAKVKGGEVDVTWLPIDRLSVRPGISYTDGYYANYPNASSSLPNPSGVGFVPVSFDAGGFPLLNTAKWTAFAQFGYELRVQNERFPTSFTYSWKDSYNQDFIIDPSQASLRQHAYALLSARVGYIPSWLPKLEVSLWGNNLANKDYFNTAVINATGLFRSYAAPRTYGVDVRYDF